MKPEHLKTLERMLEAARRGERDYSYDGRMDSPDVNTLATLREEQEALEAVIRSAKGPRVPVTDPRFVRFWDAVSGYAMECGGTSPRYVLSVRRQEAQAKVQAALDALMGAS